MKSNIQFENFVVKTANIIGSNKGSGGRGSGLFIATYTRNQETSEWTCDKTAKEIVEAWNSGQYVVAIVTGAPYIFTPTGLYGYEEEGYAQYECSFGIFPIFGGGGGVVTMDINEIQHSSETDDGTGELVESIEFNHNQYELVENSG